MFSYENNYNNTHEPKPSESDGNVVVVNFEELIFPRSINGKQKAQAILIMQKIWPSGTVSQLQEVLDEITGQTKPVNSPLGLLTTLLKKASSGEFLAVTAPKVQESRKIQEAIRQAESLTSTVDEPQQSTGTVTKEQAQERLHAMLAGLKKAGGCQN